MEFKSAPVSNNAIVSILKSSDNLIVNFTKYFLEVISCSNSIKLLSTSSLSN